MVITWMFLVLVHLVHGPVAIEGAHTDWSVAASEGSRGGDRDFAEYESGSASKFVDPEVAVLAVGGIAFGAAAVGSLPAMLIATLVVMSQGPRTVAVEPSPLAEGALELVGIGLAFYMLLAPLLVPAITALAALVPLFLPRFRIGFSLLLAPITAGVAAFVGGHVGLFAGFYAGGNLFPVRTIGFQLPAPAIGGASLGFALGSTMGAGLGALLGALSGLACDELVLYREEW